MVFVTGDDGVCTGTSTMAVAVNFGLPAPDINICTSRKYSLRNVALSTAGARIAEAGIAGFAGAGSIAMARVQALNKNNTIR